jgi:lipid II isoglutaminyl synthase (glutamine-hydrolysing)
MSISSPPRSGPTAAPRPAGAISPRDRLAVLVARCTRWTIRATRSGAGSTLPGRLAERVAPGVLGHVTRGLRPIVLVSATNGKTTTTALITAALRAAGHRVMTNSSGSNLRRGLTTAALCRRGAADCAVLEVDEATLPTVLDELDPDMLVLLNLSRDQLDRYHEVHRVASRWRAAAGHLRPGATVVAVDHDPLVCHVAQAAPEAVTVGLADARPSRDAVGCPACGELLDFRPDGPSCPACRWRPPPRQVRVERVAPGVRLEGLGRGAEASVPVSSPGYAADVAAAWAAAVRLGVPSGVAIRAISEVDVVESRYAEVAWRGRSVRLLLAKNPAGWDDSLATLGQSGRPVVVSVNSGIPDGRDPSWIWDADMGMLRGCPLVVATGARAEDVAMRMVVAGLEPVVERHLERALLLAVREGGAVDLLADYTSFQAARRLIGDG